MDVGRRTFTKCAAAVGVAAVLGACAKEGRPDGGRGPSRSSLPGLSEIDLEVGGAKAKTIAMVVGDPPGTAYKGTLTLRPTHCEPARSDVLGAALDFELSTPLGPVHSFQILPTKGSVGNLVPAVDVPYCDPGEPVYELTSGAVMVSGTSPVVKGRRGRAGAPGTQLAVEMDTAKDVERFYLLSTVSTDKFTLTADAASGTYSKTLEYAVTPDDCFEIGADGLIVQTTLTPGTHEWDARERYRAIAAECFKPPTPLDSRVLAVMPSLELKRAPAGK